MLIKLTNNLKLRKLGRKYMIVRSVDGAADMSDVFTLNASAALMWETIEAAGGSCEDSVIAAKLVEAYGISAEKASADVQKQLSQWKEFGLASEE